MKNWMLKNWMFLLFLSVGLLVFSLVGLAQEAIEPPTNWGEIVMNPTIWFSTAAYMAALVTFVAALLNGLLKVTKKFVKQLVAWGVAIILLIGSNLLNFGYNAEFPIWLSLVEGLTIGLVANGMASIPFVKTIRDAVEGWFKKE